MIPSVEPIRVAIAGVGFIGKVHARSARLAGATLVGVAASTRERAEVEAKALGAERAFRSPEELISAEDVDVVHICTPNHLHAVLAEAALEAGKHTVCEKPLTTRVEDASRLVRVAARERAVATVPFVYRYYPTVREARARVMNGKVGPVRLVHGSYLQDWLLARDDYNWRVEVEKGGPSRAVADIGSHWCDLIEFVSGHRISRVMARLLTAYEERTGQVGGRTFDGPSPGGQGQAVMTEDAASILFETDLGAVGSVVVSQISPGRKNRLWFELDGAAEALVFDQENPEELWVGRRKGSSLLVRDPQQLSPAASRYATLPGGHPQGYHDCFDAFVADTYDAIKNGRSEGLPSFEDGLRAAQITRAVLESFSTDTWMEVSP